MSDKNDLREAQMLSKIIRNRREREADELGISAKKSHEQFWILFMLCVSLIAAVALAEFCKWLDTRPDVRAQLYLD